MLNGLVLEDIEIYPRKITLIRYHVENFYSRLTKVNDQILLLINIIFKLQLSENECTYYKIKDKLTKISQTDDILDYLTSNSTAFKNIREKRNKIIHREKFLDSGFANLSALALLNKPIDGILSKYIDEKITSFNAYLEMALNWAFWAGVLLIKPYNNRKDSMDREPSK